MKLMRRLLLPAIFSLLSASTLCAQQLTPARMTFRIGVGYDRGDFGSPLTTTAAYVPFSLRYAGSIMDLGVSSGVARIDSLGGIRLIDGVPTRISPRGTPLQETGIADTTIRSRFFMLVDAGRGTAVPTVIPYVKVKLPTASEEKGLGTGKVDYGFGAELDKDVGPIFLVGELGYTIVGKVPALGLRNRPSTSFGVGKQLAENVSAISFLDWRRSIVSGNPNPTELVGVVNWRLSPTVSVTPNAYVGLTDGSPNFGAGLQLGFRFGRY